MFKMRKGGVTVETGSRFTLALGLLFGADIVHEADPAPTGAVVQITPKPDQAAATKAEQPTLPALPTPVASTKAEQPTLPALPTPVAATPALPTQMVATTALISLRTSLDAVPVQTAPVAVPLPVAVPVPVAAPVQVAAPVMTPGPVPVAAPVPVADHTVPPVTRLIIAPTTPTAVTASVTASAPPTLSRQNTAPASAPQAKADRQALELAKLDLRQTIDGKCSEALGTPSWQA